MYMYALSSKAVFSVWILTFYISIVGLFLFEIGFFTTTKTF